MEGGAFDAEAISLAATRAAVSMSVCDRAGDGAAEVGGTKALWAAPCTRADTGVPPAPLLRLPMKPLTDGPMDATAMGPWSAERETETELLLACEGY